MKLRSRVKIWRMSLLVLLLAVAGGFSLASLLERDLGMSDRFAAGIPIGLAVFGLAGFCLATWAGLTPTTVLVAALVAGAPALLWLRPADRGWLREQPSRLRIEWPAFYWVALAGLLFLVFDRALIENADGIQTGIDHNFGDLPFHLGIVFGFVRGENFWPEHPELAGVRLTYPFLNDFVTAQLIVAGSSIRFSFLAPNLLLALSLARMLYRFALQLTRERRAALLAPLVFFASGGFGFLLLATDVRSSDGLMALLRELPHDYTILFSGALRWGNALLTLLVPQRSMLLGMPLWLVVVSLWWRALEDTAQSARLLTGAGLVAGLLPLAHAHSFSVILAMGGCLVWLFPPWRRWLRFFAGALGLGLPQLAWLLHDSGLQGRSFLAWQVGWDRGETGVMRFWLYNTGLFIPCLLLALGWLAPPRVRRFYLPFALCFVVPNLLRLSPWVWDNIKFLIYWFLVSTPLVAWLLARVSHARPFLAGLLMLSLTLSGGLDLWRAVSRRSSTRIYDSEAIRFADAVAAHTPPHALVLHAPTHLTPIPLAGRRSLLGYPGHIWSQGLSSGAREADIIAIYSGTEAAPRLLQEYGVDYLMVGPQERSLPGFQEAWLERYPEVLRVGAHRLLQVR